MTKPPPTLPKTKNVDDLHIQLLKWQSQDRKLLQDIIFTHNNNPKKTEALRARLRRLLTKVIP